MQGAGPFTEFALLLLACAVVGALGVWLRQPVLITCIAVGIAIGPTGPGGCRLRTRSTCWRRGA